MYVCALNLSKAYDRVPYYRLFYRMLKVGVPVYLVRLFSVWYANQKMQVKLKKCFGIFLVGHGVRQRNVLSPFLLFNAYLDKLLIVVRSCGYGARVGYMYVGSVAYADDVNLLSPTRIECRGCWMCVPCLQKKKI